MRQAARLFKALSDDTRLRIVGLLIEGELCVCDLVAVLRMPQSTVSRHLAYLRNCGLVRDRRHGVWMHYCLARGEDGLHNDLMKILRKDLAAYDRVQEDQRHLQEYLATKRSAACRTGS